MESDGGDREEWWAVMNGGGMGNDGGGGLLGHPHPWALIVHGWGVMVGRVH